MTIEIGDRARLSGWVRLWTVLTALSWLTGGADLALSQEPFQWPLPFGDATPQSTRQWLWFLGPIIVAIAWNAVRWVWQGFRPYPEQQAARHMGTTEITRRGFGVMAKAGHALTMLAFAGAWGVWMPIVVLGDEAPDPIWEELWMTFHFVVACFVVVGVWEEITRSSDDNGGSGA